MCQKVHAFMGASPRIRSHWLLWNTVCHILFGTIRSLHDNVLDSGETNAVNARLISILLAVGIFAMGSSANAECTMNEIEKPNTRIGVCRQQPGIATGFGCTSLLMKEQVADQLQQIALARRCGFNEEADKLEKFYKLTTPYVVSLYECVDTDIDRVDVETKAKAEVDKNLAGLPAGCSAELKDKMAKRLPKLIEIDEKSLAEMKSLATKINLTPTKAK
jgi:hypothetical protein